jgi:hypothetical protein
MTHSSNSANFPLLVSREQAGNTIGAALRLFVGRGRHYSVKQLSNATGVKDRMIECAMCDAASVDYRPLPSEALLSVATFLGAVFTSEWMALAKQGAFDLPDADDPPPGMLAADNCDDAAVVTRAAIDGKFTSDEHPDLRVVGIHMIARGQCLAALGRRKAA